MDYEIRKEQKRKIAGFQYGRPMGKNHKAGF